MRSKERIVSIFLALAILVVVSSVPASAASGYARRNMKSSYSYTSFSCNFWGQDNFWDVWWGANGTSKTVWNGSKPLRADSITHQDILTCTGIGSMNIGINPSGPNASASISGHSATYSYTDSNAWKINVNFKYKHTGLLGAWNKKMATRATIKFGSTFYTWGT